MTKSIWLIIIFLSNHALASSFDILKERLRGPTAGAHQGGFVRHWPNTLKNFEYARRAGADVIEMDLHVSKDGVPVVYHDNKLNMWTLCHGTVASKTLQELKACKFKFSNSAVIPTYEEILQWAQGRVVINAEFKVPEAIAPAIQLVQKYNAYDWVYFQAKKSRANYSLAHKLDPRVALLYVISNGQEDLNWALAQDDSLLVIELHDSTRKPEIIEAIHNAGKLSSENSWHLGFPFEIFGASCKPMFDLGIDIAISNRPKGCSYQRDHLDSPPSEEGLDTENETLL